MKKFLKKHWLDILMLIYVLLPIDIIPDAIPILGTADDVIVILLDLLKIYYLEQKKNNEAISEKNTN